jgi:trimethylamine--corrinoid protein Co-methyltransferase
MHTARHFRQELWFPRLLDRDYWANWVADGATTMHARCVAMKDRLLREHEPVPLDRETARDIDGVVDAARRHLGGRL